GFCAEILPYNRLACTCRVAFIENQVDDVKHSVESLGKVGTRRDLIRNPRVADLSLRADDSLRHCRWRSEEGMRDFLGRQAAHFAQRKRHSCVGGECGM